MKRIFSIFLGSIALLLTQCSPYSLTFSETYNASELQQFNTFRIVTPDEGSLPPGMTMVSYYNIAAAIREQMVERGYVEDPNSNMLVNFGLTVRKELVNTPYTTTVQTPVPAPVPALLPPPPSPGAPVNGVVPYFIYPRAYYWPNYTTVTQWVPSLYREGVLTMDLVDMTNHSPIYSASVATILDNGDSQLRDLKGIAEAVQTLFSKFPVPVRK
ncbi:MAG: DUF4136 domain-containing protein [Bacteroides sp.]|nr:DUF4136 domain-containing protein [Bacteroides sp.]MCM1414120.1 DUF4136 domain-containing protein [Bacteroides sp.]MCM1470986.1 DUF4136 domain-containing protein [Bacteroides sp.]